MKRAVPICLLLAGCGYIPGTDARLIRQAESAIAYQLTDPGSAQFRAERVIATRAGPMVCGEVNGKNQMGAYVGFRPFTFAGSAKSAVILPANGGSNADNMAILDFPKECYPRPPA